MDLLGKFLQFTVKQKYRSVGVIFFVFVIVAFNLTIIQTADRESVHPYRMKLYYPRIDGIAQGTVVFVHGVEKGYVQEIEIVPASRVPEKNFAEAGRDKIIELTLALNEPVTLWDNYKVSFNTISLFSRRSINLDTGYYQDKTSFFFRPAIPAGGRPSDFHPLAYYYDSFVPASSLVMLENRKPLRRITRDLREITDKMNSPAFPGSIARLVNSDDIHFNLEETVNDSRIIMQEARWYSEGYRHMELMPSPFLLNLYSKQTTIGRISDRIYNQSATDNAVLKILPK